jgi:deoxyribonuclease (pyrimidine dimer)
MSRLNLIKPEHLTNIHLVAEYKEITQFLHLIKRRIDFGKSFDDLPKEYTLNGGHCLFFYNKGGYIWRRFIDLYSEMKSRGMNCDDKKYKMRLEKIMWSFGGREDLLKDYIPDEKAYAVAIDRIGLRINTKPIMYKDSYRFFNNINEYL